MGSSKTKFSLQEFLDLPESDDRAEFINGEIITKVSPKYKHASVQSRLYRFIDDWCAKEQCGRVCPEWAVVLQKLCEDRKPPFQEFRLYNHSKDLMDEDKSLFDSASRNS